MNPLNRRIFDDMTQEQDEIIDPASAGISNDNYAEIYEQTAAKKRKRELLNFDILLTIAGLCLAASSAFLPWYVFLNQEKFTVQRLAYTQQNKGSGAWPGRMFVSEKNTALQGMGTTDRTLLDLEPDMLTTASIETEEEPVPTGNVTAQRTDNVTGSLPAPRSFKLIHVADGRALIQDQSGLYVVKVGSVLPDNSTLSKLERTKNGWLMITSDGEILQKQAATTR